VVDQRKSEEQITFKCYVLIDAMNMIAYQLSGGCGAGAGGGGKVRPGSRFPFTSAHMEFTAFDTLYFFYRIVNTEGEGVAEFSSTLSVGEAIVRWLNVRDSAPIRARSC